MKTCNICNSENPCPDCLRDHVLSKPTKTVSLMVWEQGFMYPHDEWECYAYSEYVAGIPKFAEIRKI